MSGTSNAKMRTVDMRVLDKVFGSLTRFFPNVGYTWSRRLCRHGCGSFETGFQPRE